MFKTINLLLYLFLILSCKTKTATTDGVTSELNCPDDGICTFEILENQELQLLKDEFDNSYHQLNKGDGKLILKFEYKRNQDPQLADDAYSEIIFVQIDQSTTKLELEDESLSIAKVSFARMCFCRGATGIYPVKKGRLQLDKLNGEYHLKLNFKIDEVPQVIASINNKFSI